jgi:hypothetical protein
MSPGHAHVPKRPPQIQTVDLAVPNPGSSEESQVQVILHNIGHGRTIVKRAIIRILSSAQLTLCFSQGSLGLSERYNVKLPAFPTPGQIVEVPIHEQLATDEADRFALSFGFEADVVTGGPSIYLYQLELSVLHDSSPVPVKLGKVLLSLPLAPSPDEFYWTNYLGTASVRKQEMSAWGSGYYAKNLPCWRSNSLALKQLLALPGERSPALTEVGTRLVVPSARMVQSEVAACRQALKQVRERRMSGRATLQEPHKPAYGRPFEGIC